MVQIGLLGQSLPTIRPADALDPTTHYVREITGHKGSIYYRAHSYHTKVPPEGIAQAINHYTSPGAVVADPFCGSGMTGIACLLTGRSALLSDLSPAAVHISRNYVTPANASAFLAAGQQILARLKDFEASFYQVDCGKCGRTANGEYVIWSDVFSCPSCEAEILFWEGGLNPEHTEVKPIVSCGSCGKSSPKRILTWLATIPVLVSSACNQCGRDERLLSEVERDRILQFSRLAISAWYPDIEFGSWREMWRGQHRDQGIKTSADFFTNRNLSSLATLWCEINGLNEPRLRDALRFVFTSIVNRASRRYQWNPKRPTNVLTSTLYISSLSYEFNVFSLFRRKLKTIADLYRQTAYLPGKAEVQLSAAQNLSWIEDSSVDYVFTDPPFGSNIFYSDASFLWEAWLNDQTDTTFEAVVHTSQAKASGGKTLTDYENLMSGGLAEINRILRPGGFASMMFHNSDDRVWSALQRSVEASGFVVESAIAFDKSQPSFKAIKGLTAGERVPSFDLVLHLGRKSRGAPNHHSEDAELPGDLEGELVAELRTHLLAAPAQRRTTPYLHSLVMRILLERGSNPAGFSYAGVQELCSRNFHLVGSSWTIGEGETDNRERI